MSEEPLIFQTMNSVKSNSLRLKYQGLRPLGCKDIGIRNLSFWQSLNSFINEISIIFAT